MLSFDSKNVHNGRRHLSLHSLCDFIMSIKPSIEDEERHILLIFSYNGGCYSEFPVVLSQYISPLGKISQLLSISVSSFTSPNLPSSSFTLIFLKIYVSLSSTHSVCDLMRIDDYGMLCCALKKYLLIVQMIYHNDR